MISYCPHCGEYLGDYVNGVLFKSGQRVTEPHLCPGQSCVDGEGRLSRDYLDEIDRLAHYEAQRDAWKKQRSEAER